MRLGYIKVTSSAFGYQIETIVTSAILTRRRSIPLSRDREVVRDVTGGLVLVKMDDGGEDDM